MSILDVQLDGFYFIAGQVFAGDPAIETGFAYCYKMLEGTVVDIYAEMVGELGWYEFSGLASAQYIIKAEPSPNSIYYGDFLPTYYGDVLHWEEATVIDLTSGTDDAHIHLVPATTAPQGPGSISGMISNEAGRVGAANIPVILRSEDYATTYMTYSSSDGSFLFSGLSLGNYELFAEIPGKSTTPQSYVLDEANNSVTGIEMVITVTQIIFTDAGISDLFSASPVFYPNPVRDQLNISLAPVHKTRLNISLSDLAGKIILNEDYIVTGAEILKMDITNLTSGIYIINIKTEQGSYIQKIIK
jgi:hypothetical protein